MKHTTPLGKRWVRVTIETHDGHSTRAFTDEHDTHIVGNSPTVHTAVGSCLGTVLREAGVSRVELAADVIASVDPMDDLGEPLGIAASRYLRRLHLRRCGK